MGVYRLLGLFSSELGVLVAMQQLISMFPDFSHWIGGIVAVVFLAVGFILVGIDSHLSKEKKPADDNLYATIIALAEILKRGEATFEQRRKYEAILARHIFFRNENPEDYERIIRKARSLARLL